MANGKWQTVEYKMNLQNQDKLLKHLEDAKQIAEPLRRRIFIVAILTEALKPNLIRPILVGGGAVEFYTFGGYATADVDLVISNRKLLGQVLEKLNFIPDGRFWYREDLNIVIECPDEVLAGDLDRVFEVEIKGMICAIIGIEDLIVDRLNSYVYWSYEDDKRWVSQLIASQGSHLDMDYLRSRLDEDKIRQAFERILDEIQTD